ncbi:MAG: hypothetical protein LH473_04645 [Chitinophagales bacterium]|nr:hypothetical protein [Chitinophagales bacterium]
MKFPFIIILIFIPLIVLSQNYKLNTRYPGYFINIKGDSIHGYILLTNKLENQRGAVYSSDAKGEKIIIHLLADQVRGYKVKDRTYTAMYYGEPDPAAEHFVLTVAEGNLDLYEYFTLPDEFYVGTNTGGQRPATGDDEQYLQKEFLIVNKEGNKFMLPNANAFMKNADLIFGSNADLLQKIKDKKKGYRYNDLEEIVKEFNLQ